jgi:hypothetical protein
MEGHLQTERIQEDVTGDVVAPPIVYEVLRSAGQPLDPNTRAFLEPRFGYDFSHVRVHTDAQAAKSAQAVGALAYTVGRDIVFGAGQYSPGVSGGQRLLAHELAHVVQQQSAPTPILSRDPQPGGGEEQLWWRRVFVVGSPSPAEIRAQHPFQFVEAAVSAGGIGEGCVWIVERTGYEAGNIDLGAVEQRAGVAAEIRWLRPGDDLIQIINSFPRGSIIELSVFSHGLPGNVTLRYGWADRGLPNYGISLEQVRGARPDAFAPNAQVSFDSCNTATSDFASPGGNLAQQFAQRTGQDVRAWTGRTSYAEVNEPGGRDDVVASEMMRRRRPDWTEVGSQVGLGRVPERRVFSPVRGPRVGGFRSQFEIHARLPRSRSFSVPQGGAVVIRCPNPELVWPEDEQPPSPIRIDRPDVGTVRESDQSFYERMRIVSGRFLVVLHREGLILDDTLDTHTFPVESNDASAVYSNLSAGTYYIEVYRSGGQTDLPIRSTIEVDVHGER